MTTIIKLAYKNVIYHKRRTLFTLICVILSVSIIAIALFLSSSILQNVDFEGNDTNYSATKNICTTFSITAIIMSCFTICTASSISTQVRIKEYGFLSSIGMSARQKAVMIIIESLIYGIIGVLTGTALGYALTLMFYQYVSSLILNSTGINLGFINVSVSTITCAILSGFCSVLFSSFLPIIKMRKITILETIKTNNQINISLKESVLSRLAGKTFGRIGVLAGQNYDNNKGRYRAISLALSGGTIFFLTVHSFFLMPFWYELDKRNSLDGVDRIFYPLAYISALFMAYFVFVFIFCSLGSIHQNIEQRKPEFAIYKSMGMQNYELQKMIGIECFFFTWYSIWFGLIGSLIGTYAVCNFYRLVGPSDLLFHFPLSEFLIFVCVDILIGFIFSIYFRRRISQINIIDTIKNG